MQTFATRTTLPMALATRKVASITPLKATAPRLAVSRRCQVGGTTIVAFDLDRSFLKVLLIYRVFFLVGLCLRSLWRSSQWWR
jgi:hypothetical protein